MAEQAISDLERGTVVPTLSSRPASVKRIWPNLRSTQIS
jgi:hypothetical protein